MTIPAPRPAGLSKSRITAFEQCPRRLWLQVHRRELAEHDDSAAIRFETGHAVGAVACALHPEGVMVEAEPDLRAALETTAALIASGHPGPIFEATFEHDGVLVRVDVLSRGAGEEGCWAGEGGWRIAEVKSSTGPKAYHLGDLATQVWVLGEAGLPVSAAAIRHVDRDFVLRRVGDHAGLFRDADLLDVVAPAAARRGALVAEARAMLAGPEPECAMGDHCASPFPCEFSGWCGRDLPEGPEWPITILPNGGGRKWLEQGIDDLLDLDESRLSARHARVLAATRSGAPFHDAEGARRAMAEWTFPRAWLDFETIAPAVPRWIGTRPYQQVPFQFSLHLETADGTITHHEFLLADGTDPRRPCAEALARAIPPDATIIAYNAGFERSVLKELAAGFPDLAAPLLAMAQRTVDLLPVTRNHWYHRDQRGSWSIKAVLPTIGEPGYGGLEVKDGGDAQLAWMEASAPDTPPMRRWALEEALKAYCARDTWAMVAVARKLAGYLPLDHL